MKLRALELGQFRKFDRPVRLEGFGDGLNLLCGPNEMGKSTLMAALRAALFERHRASGEHIRALQPQGHKAAPWVALDFELDDLRYRIEKRFLRSEHARLHLPDGRRFEGVAAEEELQRLLGFAEPGSRGITAEQLGAWSVLWAGQGGAFAQPEIVERARRSLEGSLSAEVGALLGTDEASEIRRSASQALRELIDGHGRPKGRHKDAIAEIEALSCEIERLKQARTRLAGDVQELEAAQRRLAGLLDEREEARLLEQRDQARSRRDELRVLHDRVQTAEAQCEVAAQDHKRLRDEMERRANLAGGIDDLRRRVAEATRAEAAGKKALEQSEREIEQLHARCGEFEERRATATRKQDRTRRLQSFLHDLERLQHLEARDRQVREASERARTLRQEAEAILVTQKQIEALRAAASEQKDTEAALRAVATCVGFVLDESALDRVRLDGAPLAVAATERQVVQPLAIEIAEVGTITVTPQIAEREQLLAARQNAARRLRDLLAEAGVDHVEAAETRLRDRQRLQHEAEAAQQQAEFAARAALPGIDGPEALRAEIERCRSRVGAERAALQLERWQDQNELREELVAVNEEIVKLEQSLQEAAAGFDSARSTREQHLAAHARASEAAHRARVDLEARVHELERAESEQPRAALDQAVTEATARLEERRRDLAALRERSAESDLELVESELARLERAIERRRSDVGDLRVQIATLRSSIEKDEGAGLDEQIEDAARRLELRERERTACEREIHSLRLLLKTLDEAERAAKERYLQPVVNRLRPYLCRLLPDAKVRIDDAFRIRAIEREASGEEPFEQLSDGTREQIAVLARLAFAEMLADQGLPVVVVLDDALAFSDDHRLEQMFDILHHAARRLQIVVFTCRERLFENLGATRLRLCEVTSDAAAAD